MNRVLYCNKKYYAVYMPSHPRAFKDGYVYEHILQAEKKLGRALKPEEVVHHIDKNGLNNDLENLLVFSNAAEHVKYHYVLEHEKEYVLEVNDGVCSVSYESPRCEICGAEISSYQCRYCVNCYRIQSRVVDRPDRNVLKEDIRNMPMTTVAKKYHVTDNAVRKWCVRYNLPKKIGLIRQYTDQEWEEA